MGSGSLGLRSGLEGIPPIPRRSCAILEHELQIDDAFARIRLIAAAFHALC